jgi:hypothetical protein
VAKLYIRGGRVVFACRLCFGLTYTSQLETPKLRAIRQARKIRMGLGGGESLVDPFPDKPRGMHWRRYDKLRERADAALWLSFSLL